MNGGPRILVYGYGNPGRLDDGLGPALVAALERRGLERVTTDSDYQLTVEDAAEVAEHDVTIFVDADVDGPEPFWFDEIEPDGSLGFSSHSVSPQKLLDMSRGLLGKAAKGYILGIRGYEFNEFGERLSEGARRNLGAALDFIEEAVRDGHLDRFVRRRREEAQRGDK